MDKEEILQSVRMPEVLSRYGIRPNRTGMISCPFHGRDRHPSMKIYKDGFKCFTCKEYGNVIDFVMKYEEIDFKTAFISLGGTYAHMTEKERILTQIRRDRSKGGRCKQRDAEDEFKLELGKVINLCRNAIDVLEPFSDEWLLLSNKLPWLLDVWNEKYVEGKEINEVDVIRVCGQIRQTIDSIT